MTYPRSAMQLQKILTFRCVRAHTMRNRLSLTALGTNRNGARTRIDIRRMVMKRKLSISRNGSKRSKSGPACVPYKSGHISGTHIALRYSLTRAHIDSSSTLTGAKAARTMPRTVDSGIADRRAHDTCLRAAL